MVPTSYSVCNYNYHTKFINTNEFLIEPAYVYDEFQILCVDKNDFSGLIMIYLFNVLFKKAYTKAIGACTRCSLTKRKYMCYA